VKDDQEPETEEPKTDDAPEEPEKAPTPAVDPAVAANAHYLAGRYADAEPLLREILATPGTTGTRPAQQMDRIRLYRILLRGIEQGASLEGPALALIKMPGGRRMLVNVIEETPDELEFRAPRGIRSRMKKSEFRDLTVAAERGERLALLEREYRFRHETTRTSGEFLALGRFCYEAGLIDHLTYCMERSLTAPGDEVREALTAEFEAAREAGDGNRRQAAAELFERFFPNSEIAGGPVALPDRPEIEITDAKEESGTDARSGIGGVRERKISRLGKRDPKLAALFKEAEKHRAEGDRYYKKAFGSKGTSEDREKALAAYRKAQELYEQAEERWGVALESTFKDIQTRVYDLIKSGR
jgi:hypothetical protein